MSSAAKEEMSYAGTPSKGELWFTMNRPPKLEREDVRCLFYDDSVEGQDCEDTCYGEVCFSSEQGLILLGGLLAPGLDTFAREKGSSEY